MAPRNYQTLAVELVEVADRVADDLEVRGYRVLIEKRSLGCPFVPTLLCTRANTTLIIEVVAQISNDRLNALAQYAGSCGTDTRVALAVPSTVALPHDDQARLQDAGIGLFHGSASSLVETLQARDLALHVTLPERRSLSREVRVVLGSAYDHFDQGDWREGFEEACQAFEAEARRYLKKWTKSNRILIVAKKGPVKLTPGVIEKLTMGGLAHNFARIQTQTPLDVLIGDTLDAINKDRIAVAHHKKKKTSETRLRKNVGRDMWAITHALTEMLKP